MRLTVIPGALTNVDATALVTPGSRYVDDSTGNEYVYALGIGSCVAGSWVALNLETTGNTPKVALLTKTLADGGVSIGVALAAVVANYYGWFQIYGAVEALAKTLDAANAIQYTTDSAGYLDDSATSQTAIHGIRLVDTVGGADALATFFISYPRSKN